MQKRAENEAAANDLFIAEFIKTVQLNTVRPARQRSSGAMRPATSPEKKPSSGSGSAKTPIVDNLFTQSLANRKRIRLHPEGTPELAVFKTFPGSAFQA